jgi:uncharacterized membrane protein
MEMIKSISFFITLLLLGFSAGFFYSWEVSVIPGTSRVSNLSYLETMQQINRAILNPKFFLRFFGSLIFLVLSSYLHYRDAINSAFWLMLLATIAYLFGTFGVTAFGNVPLNDALDAINLQQLNSTQLEDIRLSYESKWNRLHTIRTLFSMLSFSLALLALFVNQKAAENSIHSIF